MAKCLFFSLPAAGHVNPSLAMVAELVRRGDEVTYYATAPFAERVSKCGATYKGYENRFLEDLSNIPEHLPNLYWLLTRVILELLERDLEEYRRARPDYIVTDSVAPWGHWVGKLLGVPVVTSVSTFAFNRKVMRAAFSLGVRPKNKRLLWTKVRDIGRAMWLGRELRRKYGVNVPGLNGIVLGKKGVKVVYTSKYFQPCAESFGDNFHFVGPSLAASEESAGFPWERVGEGVLIYISLGTLFNDDAAFYKKCFEAFGGGERPVVLSLGGKVDVGALGPVPGNFVVQAHVPQVAVLRRASVFVTHGGMNSVSESLYLGVPVLVIPQMGEQQLVGRRTEQLGAGIYLAKEDVTVERLRSGVERLIADGRYREQAAVIGDSFVKAGLNREMWQPEEA